MHTYIRNDECHHKQTFLSHLFSSLWTLLLLAGNCCPGGIERSCLRHKYSFTIALTARRNCKKSATFSIMLVICGLEKFCCRIHHHFLHSDHSQTKKYIYNNKKWRLANISTYMELFVERWSKVTSKRCDCVINCHFLIRYHLDNLLQNRVLQAKLLLT